MLLEYITLLTTKTPSYVRKMGFLAESIATYARYKRCHHAWKLHVNNTKQFILDATDSCVNKRTALILGSGYLLDIPIAALSEQFEKVLLVDIVHPKRTQRQCKHYSNVSYITEDISAVALALFYAPLELPTNHPSLLLDDDNVDFVVSANVLSQLSVKPEAWIRKHGGDDSLVNDLRSYITRSHIDYLAGFNAVKCVITDAAYRLYDREGRMLNEDTLAFVDQLPAVSKEWEWNIAPMPELIRDRDVRHKIVATIF